MHPILRNVLAIIAGIAVGMIVITLGHMISMSIMPLPEGADPAKPETFKENIHLFEFKDFILPTIAHALGTLAGAFTAAKIVVNNKLMFGIVIGVFFLVAGIMNTLELGPPLSVTIMDLVLAYIPMGWLGGKLASR